jgi:Restriction endonuclease
MRFGRSKKVRVTRMSERVPIEGRVARILNLRELAINRGSSDGVRVGMVFDVLDPKAEDIEDPESGDVLGSVYRPKVQVKVFAVEERLSLARTFKSTRVNLGGSGGLGGLARAFEPPKWVEHHETLKTSESTWQDLDESESMVKTGDPIVEALVVEGAADAAGSRTLEYAEAAREFEREFSEWLTRNGWTVGREPDVPDHGIDLVASRGDEVLLVEAKIRRGPIAAADAAQAVGWLTAARGLPGKTVRHALVVGPAGLTSDAVELLRSHPAQVEVYEASPEGGFSVVEGPRALGMADPESDDDAA